MDPFGRSAWTYNISESRKCLDRMLGIPALGAGVYAAVVVISWLAYVAGSRPATARSAASQKAA